MDYIFSIINDINAEEVDLKYLHEEILVNDLPVQGVTRELDILTVTMLSTLDQQDTDLLSTILSEHIVPPCEVTLSENVFRYQADQFMNVDPIGSDYAVNNAASAGEDSNNAACTVRLFDDTTEEGVGFLETIPEGATNIIFKFKSRAETTPGGSVAVVPKIYVRDIPDNAAVGAWDSGTDLTALAFTTNEYFQYDEQTIALTTLGLVAGDTHHFELTRNTGSGSDTLSGDWALLEMTIKFS